MEMNIKSHHKEPPMSPMSFLLLIFFFYAEIKRCKLHPSWVGTLVLTVLVMHRFGGGLILQPFSYKEAIDESKHYQTDFKK